MKQQFVGWALVVGGLAAVLTALGAEVSGLSSWEAALTPAFVGRAAMQVGGAIAAFLGGKALPAWGEK